MRVASMPALAVVAVAAMASAAGQAPALRITSPVEDAVMSGAVTIAVDVSPVSEVRTVSFFVDGRLACATEQPPHTCAWDGGAVVRGHHVRVVATFVGGQRLVDNVRTKDFGYTEKIRVDAVLVPVVVTERGKFVRGLKKNDFRLFEDNVVQPLGSLVSEEAPLELVLAIDISGSMETALPGVKIAVKQLLSKLRPGDAATLVGFNDTTFVVAERETDRRAREDAVELLASWGGTALYDATVKAMELVSRGWGRKGVVLFSDGDDRNSLTRRDTAMARVQSSDAMLFTVGFGAAGASPELRKHLEAYARSTGGRAFFPRDSKGLDVAFDEIITELSNQYVLTYSSTNAAQNRAWRNIKVEIPKAKYAIRARQGYRAVERSRAGR